MRNLIPFLYLLLFCIAANVWASPQEGIIRIEQFEKEALRIEDNIYLSRKIDIPIELASPFISVAVVWEACDFLANHDQLSIKTYQSDGSTELLNIKAFDHADPKEERFISQLYYIDAASKSFQFRIETNGHRLSDFGAMEIHFYSPGASEDIEIGKAPFANNRSICPCPPTNAIARSQWCPNGDCPPHSNPVTIDVTHLIVHHSAGSNTSTDWAASVRAIWNFHVNTNGWSDIGYNYLVDPNGKIYEGRGEDILGAHFCGTNSGTMGTCMMGDFTDITPTDEAIAGLIDLLSWKACVEDLDPLGMGFHASSGLDLNFISGHRQGCATQCPGNTFFPTFPNLRESVKENIAACEYLGAPYDLDGAATTEMVIQLNWEDNSPNENAFIVERSQGDNSQFQVIGSTGPDSTLFKDPDIIANVIYYYRVKAVNEQDTSAYSNEARIPAVITMTATTELEKQALIVYPNPFTKWIQVNLAKEEYGQKQIKLYELTGRQLLSSWQSQNKQIQVDLSNLAKGIYLLEVEISGQFYYQKIMKSED